MKNANYFNDTNPYKEPILIKFDEPIEIRLCDYSEFLDSYKPFYCCDVYGYERFEYGDFDNWMDAIIMNKSISPSFSHYHEKQEGIYNEGDVSYCIQTMFWNYSNNNKPFWDKVPTVGYEDVYKPNLKKIEDIKVKVDGIYVISWSDKDKVRKQ